MPLLFQDLTQDPAVPLILVPRSPLKVSQLFLIFMFAVLRKTIQETCRMSSNLLLTEVSPWLDWVPVWGGKKPQRWRAFSLGEASWHPQGIPDIHHCLSWCVPPGFSALQWPFSHFLFFRSKSLWPPSRDGWHLWIFNFSYYLLCFRSSVCLFHRSGWSYV